MLTGIDHVLIACADPDRAAEQISADVGLHVSGGGRHEQPGTFNRLIWLGDSYVELMGVWDAERAAANWWGRHALAVLAAAAAAGRDAGYMGVVLASDNVDTDAELLRRQGSVLGEPEAGMRLRPDGRVVRWRMAHEVAPDPDLGTRFIIEHDRTAAEWTPPEVAERAEFRHPLGGPARLLRVELPVAAMRDATMRIHRDLGIAFRPSLAGDGARDASIGRQTLRLLRGGGSVLPGIVVSGGSDRRETTTLGMRWQIVPAGSG